MQMRRIIEWIRELFVEDVEDAAIGNPDVWPILEDADEKATWWV